MLITNKKVNYNFKKFGKYYYQANEKDKIIKKDNQLLIVKGYLYPDIDYKFINLFNYLSKEKIGKSFKKFKGKYCGVFIDYKKDEMIIFNDQLGLNDIFYYYKNNDIIISDNFVCFFELKDFYTSDLDITALGEFLLYEHVFLNRTFINNIKILRYATLKKINLYKNLVEETNFWDYAFKKEGNFNRKKSMKNLDLLFKQSIQRIHKLNPNKEFLIGLSGGLDSRLVAKYAIQESMRLHPFVFSNKNSDAFYISQKISKVLKLNLKKLVVKDDYWKWKDKHIRYNPIMNLMYTAYYSIAEDIDKNKIMLTGFNGDNLFGSHIKRKDFKKRYNIIEKINRKYRLNIGSVISTKLNRNIYEDLQIYDSKNLDDWSKTEIFNFESRQLRFIKGAPSFSFYGDFHNNFSMFADIDLVEFVLTFPLNELKNCKLYHDFICQYHSDLAQIRSERKPYSLLNDTSIKIIKKIAFKIKQIIKNYMGISLPIFNTISYQGALDWEYLFQLINFKKEYKKINILDIFDNKIFNLDNTNIENIRIKYHYLTIQNFIYRYIK